MTCVCGHTQADHRHLIFDDTHPYIDAGDVIIARSAGPCMWEMCGCDRYFAPPSILDLKLS